MKTKQNLQADEVCFISNFILYMDTKQICWGVAVTFRTLFPGSQVLFIFCFIEVRYWIAGQLMFVLTFRYLG